MTLYEINEQLMNCFFEPEAEEVIDSTTGEVFDAGYLDRLEMARDEKIENIALWIKNLDAEAEAIKAEKMKLAKRQQATEKRVESLRSYLSQNLNGEKFSTPRVALSFRSSEKVEIEDSCLIPKEFMQITEKPMLAEIKKAIKGGADVAGARIQRQSTLQIK